MNAATRPAAVAEPTSRHSAARDSATVAGWTLVSRVTGLLRILTIGAVLGPTYFANIFQAAYVLPSLIYTLIAGPVLAMVVVPGLVRALTGRGTERAKEILGRLSAVLLVASSALAAVLVLAAPLLAWTLTFGIADDAGRARAHDLAVVIMWFVAPQVILFVLVALTIAAQQARGRFAIAAGAPAAENLGVMATMAVVAVTYGTGHDLDTSMNLVVMLGVGSTLSVALHALFQVYGATRAGVAIRPRRAWRSDHDVVGLLRRLGQSLHVAACQSGGMYAVLAVAATVPGGVFVLQVVYAVHHAVIALGAHAVSTAVLPRLAAAAHAGDPTTFAAHWRRGVSYAAIVGLPAVVLLIAFAEPSANLLARGEVGQRDVVGELALCLMVVALTQLAGGLSNLGRQAMFARLDVRGASIAAIAQLLATTVVAGSALELSGSASRLVVLALAIVAGETAGAAVAVARLRPRFGRERFIDLPALVRTAGAVAMMFPVAVAGPWLVGETRVDGAAGFALFGLCGVAALAVYVAALRTVWRHIAEGVV